MIVSSDPLQQLNQAMKVMGDMAAGMKKIGELKEQGLKVLA